MKYFRFKKIFSISLAAVVGCAACSVGGCKSSEGTDFSPSETWQSISIEEYTNKTLAGLLGQFAGFLSGYEFITEGGGLPRIGLPDEWFDFINGPYAGNFEYYCPSDAYHYDRLLYNDETNMNEVYSDDDYHIDILNQYVLKEAGYSSYAIKETWKKYLVSDWGGGSDAMRLISSSELLAPFTGTIEAGNRYGWCTEAYIENETLGMNAAGMPNVATGLVDTFASNVGYYDSVIWAKFYAAMYSMAYFETDIVTVLQKAKSVLPEGSTPYKAYETAFEMYEQYPEDWRTAAQLTEATRTPLYNIDNIQTDANINGAFAILSWLYGGNSYLETAKISSLIGYDGDCTAAICCGAMGILKGFQEGNEEYEAINSMLYYDGAGVYRNDEGDYTARMRSDEYPSSQTIDSIVDMYRENFETILLANGGKIEDGYYMIPTTELVEDHSFLFENYGAELRTTDGFRSDGGELSVYLESANEYSNSGYACFLFQNTSDGEVYHTYSGLVKGKTYRLSVFVRNSDDAQIYLFARKNSNSDAQTISFSSTSLINKEFVFTATDSTMQVGFMFGGESNAGDVLYFDDFQLEEIDREQLSTVSEQELKSYSGTYSKIVKCPTETGTEVILSVQVRNYTGQPMTVGIYRNGDFYGSIVISNTSVRSSDGYGYVEIPYVFENQSDTIQLNFNGATMYVGTINIYKKTQYMFR